MARRLIATLTLVVLCGCAPEPGSKAWCDKMADTPKGDWSTNDATEYAKSCVFQSDED